MQQLRLAKCLPAGSCPVDQGTQQSPSPSQLWDERGAVLWPLSSWAGPETRRSVTRSSPAKASSAPHPLSPARCPLAPGGQCHAHPLLTVRSCECVTLRGKWGFADGIQLRALRGETVHTDPVFRGAWGTRARLRGLRSQRTGAARRLEGSGGGKGSPRSLQREAGPANTRTPGLWGKAKTRADPGNFRIQFLKKKKKDVNDEEEEEEQKEERRKRGTKARRFSSVGRRGTVTRPAG